MNNEFNTSHPKIILELENIVGNKCSLGEGLFIKKDSKAWVDINNDKIFTFSNNILRNFKTKTKPSIIFDINENNIVYGSDKGIINFDHSTTHEKAINLTSNNHALENYRSNDGGYCLGTKFLSFMHRSNPNDYPGYVYKVSNGKWHLIDDSLHIPNTFIEIESGKLIVSDSLKREIWLFEFTKNGLLENKTLWKKYNKGCAPDGGCMVNDLILITMWDDASISVLEKSGKVLQNLKMPVIRPTNCKFDSKNSRLWVTSAYDGLDKSDLTKYPLSGETLIFKLALQY